MTDGLPNGCNSTIAAAVAVAQSGFATQGIKTFVVGLGNTANLDQIALAGSGGSTHYFPVTGDVATPFTAALNAIAAEPTCGYALASNQAIDPSLVNVQVDRGAGVSAFVGRVSDAAACGSTGGWYYDNPAQPTKLTLCPSSCESTHAMPGSQVKILYGCPSLPG